MTPERTFTRVRELARSGLTVQDTGLGEGVQPGNCKISDHLASLGWTAEVGVPTWESP